MTTVKWRYTQNIPQIVPSYVNAWSPSNEHKHETNSEPRGAARQYAIAKTPVKLSAYQIPSVIVVFLILVFKVEFVSLIPKSHKRP
jgi:hypothetical protein